MDQAILAFLLAGSPSLPDLRLDGINRPNLILRLGGQLRLRPFRLDELAPGMRPALGMGQAGLAGVLGISGVTVGEQHAAFHRGEAERLFHVGVGPAVEERETYLVQFVVDRPEVAALQLARFGPPRLDRGFVHCLDVRGAN